MKRHEDFFPPFHLWVKLLSARRGKKESVRIVDSCEAKKPYVEAKLSEKGRPGREGGEWQTQYRIRGILRLISFSFSLF